MWHILQCSRMIALAHAVVKAPKSSHITPILRSLHWLKITEHIEYKLLSLTYKVLTTTQPLYLHNLITVQPPRSTRSSSLVTLARPSTSSSLQITDCTFQYASLVSGTNSRLLSVNHALICPILHHPVLWVALPPSVPSTHHFHHPLPLHSFTPGLKLSFPNPSHCSLPFLLLEWLHGFPGLFTDTSEHIHFYFLLLFFFHFFSFWFHMVN